MYCYEVKDCFVENGIKLSGLTTINVGRIRVFISRRLLRDPNATRGEYLVEANLDQLSLGPSEQASYVLAGSSPSGEEFQEPTPVDCALVLVNMMAPKVSTCEVILEGDQSSRILAKDQQMSGNRKFLQALLLVRKNSPVRLVDRYTSDHECNFWCNLLRGSHYRGSWDLNQLIEFDGQNLTARFLPKSE